MNIEHYVFYISNSVDKRTLIFQINEGKIIAELATKKGVLFSELALDHFIADEKRHGYFDVITAGTKVSLQKYSDGEKRLALLSYILSQNPDYIIADNIYDNLDANSILIIKKALNEVSEKSIILQIANRESDILPFIRNLYSLENQVWTLQDHAELKSAKKYFLKAIPPPYDNIELKEDSLIKFNNVSISYDGIPIVKDICWEIKRNEFWQLIGPNGVGKSTLLSLIIGDNPKAYGQDITLFGIKKGGGETVRQLKKFIGYFTSEVRRGFERRESIEKMVLSGFFDTIGLYKQPTKHQIKIMVQWLHLLGLYEIRKKNFSFLSLGQQRLVLIARAMVKHPPLLILDEPTAGLDDASVLIFTELIHKIQSETNTTILYVSHRKEKSLTPDHIFELKATDSGAVGNVVV